MTIQRVGMRRPRLLAALAIAAVAVTGSVALLRPADDLVLATVSLGAPNGPASPLLSLPLAIDERTSRAFISFDDGAGIRVLDTATGALQRTVAAPRSATALVADTTSARVFAVCGQDLLMLDARNGAVLRDLPVSPLALALDEPGGRVYVLVAAGGKRALETLDARTGQPLRALARYDLTPFATNSDSIATLAVDGRRRRVIVTDSPYTEPATPTGTLRVFDAASGRLLSRQRLNGIAWRPPLVDEETGRAFVPVYVEGGSFARGAVLMLDTASGAARARTPLGSAFFDLALDRQAGRVLATDVGALRHLTLPSGAREDVPIGPGEVRLFDARSGARVGSVQVGVTPWAIAVDERAGRLFVLNPGATNMRSGELAGPGSLSVVDERTGSVVRTARVGVRPMGLALDRAAGRLVVLNDGGLVARPAVDPWGWIPSWARGLLPFIPGPPRDPTIAPASISVLDMTRL